MVMPGVQWAVPVPVQLATAGVFAGRSQFVPLQQTVGVLAVLHVSPGAQPPVVSQRHPCWPATHTCGRPLPLALVPPPHLLGTPGLEVLPQPQHCGAVQVPQSTTPPQPSDIDPQSLLPADWQVVLVVHALGH